MMPDPASLLKVQSEYRHGHIRKKLHRKLTWILPKVTSLIYIKPKILEKNEKNNPHETRDRLVIASLFRICGLVL